MVKLTNVQGSIEQAKPLIIGVDTVYVHTNIHAVEGEHGTVYVYDEVQYTYGEFMEKQQSDTDYIAIMTGVVLDV